MNAQDFTDAVVSGATVTVHVTAKAPITGQLARHTNPDIAVIVDPATDKPIAVVHVDDVDHLETEA